MAKKEKLIEYFQYGTHNRLIVSGVPLDLVDPNQLNDLLEKLLFNTGTNQVVFLRVVDFMRALRNPELKSCLQKASLVIPISKSFQLMAKFLGLPKFFRIMAFDFVVKILNILEAKRGSYYILGDDSRSLQVIEKNIKDTFPDAQALGKFVGHYNNMMEANVVKAISKASPNLLLLGKYLVGDDLWANRRRSFFSRGLQVWSSESFDYFALRRKRPLRNSFGKGREVFAEVQIFSKRFFKLSVFFLFHLWLLWLRLAKPGKIKSAP